MTEPNAGAAARKPGVQGNRVVLTRPENRGMGEAMRRNLLIFGYGLLPLWIALLALAVAIMAPESRWSLGGAAPWLVIVSIPISGITLAIAIITVTQLRPDWDTQSTPKAGVIFIVLNAALFGYGYWDYAAQKAKEKERRQMQEQRQLHSVTPAAFPRLDKTGGGVKLLRAEVVRQPRAGA